MLRHSLINWLFVTSLQRDELIETQLYHTNDPSYNRNMPPRFQPQNLNDIFQAAADQTKQKLPQLSHSQQVCSFYMFYDRGSYFV